VNRAREKQALDSGSPAAAGSTGQSVRKRSITIAGHRTSVSLEDAFWIALGRIAESRECSTSQLVTQIDRERTGNLSSAIRVFVLNETAAGSDAEGRPGRPAFGADPQGPP